MIVVAFVLCLIAPMCLAAFDPHLNHHLCLMANIAYEPLHNIAAWNCSLCAQARLTDIKAFENRTEDIQGFVGYQPERNAITVVFRGSIDIKNYLVDFDINQVQYKRCAGCLVHVGFNSAYNQVVNTVRAQVQLLLSKYRNAAIHVTGHSLGSAIATLAALDIADNFGHVDQYYSYGQPRIGNEQFARYINQELKEYYRSVHYADLWTHLPPREAKSYMHPSFEVWYTEDMQNYKMCVAEDPTCSDSIPLSKRTSSDHDQIKYLNMPV